MAPSGTTHTQDFYGATHFFRRNERQHLNQVSEEWQTLTSWDFWNGSKWISVGGGFSNRLLVPYESAEA